MPLYEYECQQCKRHTEKIQKFSDPEITTCPHCGGPLQRVITAPAIAFKGGGWYKDGYGSSAPKAAAAESSSSSSTDSGSSSSTESTPAPTPAPAVAPAASSPTSAEKK